jgi:hypothetical protein
VSFEVSLTNIPRRPANRAKPLSDSQTKASLKGARTGPLGVPAKSFTVHSAGIVAVTSSRRWRAGRNYRRPRTAETG